MKKLTTIFLTLTISITASLNAEILFSDNFNIDGSGNVDTDYDVAGRQSGTFSPLEYSSTIPTLTDTGIYAGKYFCDQRNDSTPLHNFTESGNFCMAFDMDLYTNFHTTFQVMSCGKANGSGYGTMVGFDVFWGNYLGSSLYAVSETNNDIQFFSVPGLFSESNMAHKVKVGVSLTGFPPAPEDKCHAVMFIDDRPYPFSIDTRAFVRTLASNLYNDNYISIGNWDGYGLANPPATVDNFTIATLHSNDLSTTAWTSDADSGIDSSKTYTHAVSFGDSAGFSVNGVPFTGSGSAMSGSGWELVTADSSPLSGPTASSTLNITGASSGIASNFMSSASYDNAGALIISGLTPNMQYELSLFCAGSEASGGRQSYFATSGGSPIYPIDQDEFGAGNGQRLICVYTASKDGAFTILTTPLTDSTPTWNWYGFCNKALPPIAPTSISATKGIYADKIHVNWDEVLPAQSYFLYRAETNDLSSTNFVVQVISNFFDDTVPSVEIAKDYYYWVKACNTAGCSALSAAAFGFTKSEFPPEKPVNLSPKDFNVVTSPVTLVASSYSDTGSYGFAASQWQVAKNPGFFPVEWDSDETIPTETFTPPTSIIPEGTNFWRVRYKNNRNSWSDYSDDTSFIFVKGKMQSGVFRDTFNVSGSGDVNHGYANAGRQNGSATPLTYTVLGSTEIGNASSNPGELLLGLNSGCAPNYSFTESGEFIIEFDAEPHMLDGSNDWVALNFGKNDNSDFFPISPYGAGLVFFTGGQFQAFDGMNLVGNGFGVPTNEKIHITLVASTEDFDYSSVKYAAFANGIPMLVSSAKNGYIYEDSAGFEQNYISVSSFNFNSPNPSLIDNLKVSKAMTNEVRTSRWVSDSTSLIDPLKDYTHAVNLNGDPVEINGLQFEGTGHLTNWISFPNGSSMIKTNDWEIMGSLGSITFIPFNQISNIVTDAASKSLMEYMVFPGDPAASAIKLYGLAPYSSNTLAVYSHGWEAAGRTEFFTGLSGGTVTSIDQDTYGRGIGIVLQYDYIASGDGTFTFVASPDAGAGFIFAGFTSEMTGIPEPCLFIIYNLLFIIYWRKLIPRH